MRDRNLLPNCWNKGQEISKEKVSSGKQILMSTRILFSFLNRINTQLRVVTEVSELEFKRSHEWIGSGLKLLPVKSE